jgi:PHD and RING finger domain-containing protein 1
MEIEVGMNQQTPNEKNNNSNDDSSSEGEGEMSDSDCSTDSNAEKCPICLLSFDKNQEIGKPIVCNHSFCFPCINEWSKVVQTCPIDRKEFTEINVYDFESDKIKRTITVAEKISLKEYANDAQEITFCEICRNSDREEVMLLCDGCDKGNIFYTSYKSQVKN